MHNNYGAFGNMPTPGQSFTVTGVGPPQVTTVRPDGVGSQYLAHLKPEEVLRAFPPRAGEPAQLYGPRLNAWIKRHIGGNPRTSRKLVQAVLALHRRGTLTPEQAVDAVEEGAAEYEVSPEAYQGETTVDSGGNASTAGGVAPNDADWMDKIRVRGPSLGAVALTGGLILGGIVLVHALTR